MNVWMIHASHSLWSQDITEGPFVSKEHVFNDSTWSNLSWTLNESPTEQYITEFSGWELCLYQVNVQGS